MSQGVVHVAAAAVFDRRQRILVSKRPDHVHQGGLWEFPGGKVEADESVAQALARELEEELGIRPVHVRPLIRVPHAYPDKHVVLDVYRVDRFEGVPEGREGQPFQWVDLAALSDLDFPAANRPIVTACLLPSLYPITPEPGQTGLSDYLSKLQRCMTGDFPLVQLRAKSLSDNAYAALAEKAVSMGARRGVGVILNGHADLVSLVGAAGVHLPIDAARRCRERPVDDNRWFGVSCHDEDELAFARTLGADYAFFSPVAATPTHPDVSPLGWQRFKTCVHTLDMPVYALGGVGARQLHQAWQAGAQGVAGIRAFWPT